LISQGVHPLGRVKQGWDVDNKITNYFRAKCVNVSQAVGDTSKLSIIRLRTLGEEAFGVILSPSENCT